MKLSLPCALDELKEMTRERTKMPMISSMMALETKAEPILVSSFPISFNVLTVMLTEVAVKMTP